MSKVKDNTPINLLTIPGTHDSATAATPIIFVRTQQYGIENQLRMGIRFLDIRLKYASNGKSEDLFLFHGPVPLVGSFGDVLASCKKFLAENNKEVIFMSIKDEGAAGATDFQRVFTNNYYKSGVYKDIFYKKEIKGNFPDIKDVRGKIVLMLRSGLDRGALVDDLQGIELNIGDKVISDCKDINDNTLKLCTEDLYEPGSDQAKIDAIKNNIKAAKASIGKKEKKLWLTFTTANIPGKGKSPEYYAQSPDFLGQTAGIKINGWLNINGKLESGELGDLNRPMGIVALDFPTWGVVGYLIRSNNQ